MSSTTSVGSDPVRPSTPVTAAPGAAALPPDFTLLGTMKTLADPRFPQAVLAKFSGDLWATLAAIDAGAPDRITATWRNEAGLGKTYAPNERPSFANMVKYFGELPHQKDTIAAIEATLRTTDAGRAMLQTIASTPLAPPAPPPPDRVDPPQTPPPSTQPTLGRDKTRRGPAVEALQKRLVGMGLLESREAKGVFDAVTEGAMADFQRLYNLRVPARERIDTDGVCGQNTWRALDRYKSLGATPNYNLLIAVDANGKCLPPNYYTLRNIPGQNQDANQVSRLLCVALQMRLKQLGYLDSVDYGGVFGPNCEAAVKKAQAALGLPATGVVGTPTWKALGGATKGGMTDHVTPGAVVPEVKLADIKAYPTTACYRRLADHNNPSSEKWDVKGVVLHHTATDVGTIDGTITWFSDEVNEASSDFIIEGDGTIAQMRAVSEPDKLKSLHNWAMWHAGQSTWRTYSQRREVNKRTIGLEIVNNGLNCQRYSQEQLLRTAGLVRAIVKEFGLNAKDCITTHRDIAPDRKNDPSNTFDYESFLIAVQTGKWPA